MTPGPEAPLVLWVIPVADLGGVARHVLDVAAHGIPGHRLVVLAPEGPLPERLRRIGAAVTTGAFGPAAGLARSVRTLRQTVRTLRPAAVHSHLAYADIVVAATPMPPGSRRFTTEHGIAGGASPYHRSRRRASVMAQVHRRRLRRFDGVIAVSEATRRAMVDVWHATARIAVVRNGVGTPPARGLHELRAPGKQTPPRNAARSDTELRVLSLSRLAPEKRIDRLVEAFAVVREHRPEATLTIAGTGPLAGDLRRQAARLGVADAVSMPGFVDAAHAMAQADVVAQLSVWENCSYSLLDAAAMGLGVVAADVGGNPEILPPGALVDPDDPGAVAQAILRAVDADVHPPDWTVGQMCQAIAATYERSRG